MRKDMAGRPNIIYEAVGIVPCVCKAKLKKNRGRAQHYWGQCAMQYVAKFHGQLIVA